MSSPIESIAFMALLAEIIISRSHDGKDIPICFHSFKFLEAYIGKPGKRWKDELTRK